MQVKSPGFAFKNQNTVYHKIERDETGHESEIRMCFVRLRSAYRPGRCITDTHECGEIPVFYYNMLVLFKTRHYKGSVPGSPVLDIQNNLKTLIGKE